MDFKVEAELPPGMSYLKNVDALLRCPICFDFLNISMMTKCSHNFCSLCIRKFFSYKLQCPVCNSNATEQDLRNNRLLDELVVNFLTTRQQLSKATFDSPPISPKTPASAFKCKTTPEKGQRCNGSVLSQFFQKKPKRPPGKEERGDSCDAHCVRWGGGQTAGIHNAANHTNSHSVAVKAEPIDVDLASVQGWMSVKQEDAGSHTISPDTELAHSSSPSKDVKPVIKVPCPVCAVGVSQQFINKHLDTCLTRGEKKESLRSSLGGTKRRPMTKLVYNLLSLQELKRKLKECNLSMAGSRDQLIKRHRDFVHTYNAQCDSLNPKSAEDIAKELEADEKIRNRLQGKTKPVMVFSKNQSEKEINEMHSNYRTQHSTDFSRLIAQVRGRLETARDTHIKQEVTVGGEDAPKTHSADKVSESDSLLAVKVERGNADPEPFIDLTSSPTHSDVSISSSISDIFGPEPDRNPELTETTTVQKRTSSMRGNQAAPSPVFGKRRRKT